MSTVRRLLPRAGERKKKVYIFPHTARACRFPVTRPRATKRRENVHLYFYPDAEIRKHLPSGLYALARAQYYSGNIETCLQKVAASIIHTKHKCVPRDGLFSGIATRWYIHSRSNPRPVIYTALV